MALQAAKTPPARSAWYAQAMERLVGVVEDLSRTRSLEDVMAIVRRAADDGHDVFKAAGAGQIFDHANQALHRLCVPGGAGGGRFRCLQCHWLFSLTPETIVQ